MRQLSGTDSLFLRLERGNQYMHVAGLGIYDPSTATEGRVRFKDVLRFFQARLDSLLIFRRRLVTVPLGLDRSKPLSEAYLIEGLDHIPGLLAGSFALYLKIHHCAVDGEAGTDLIRAIHSTLAEDFSEPAARLRRYQERMPQEVPTVARLVTALRKPPATRFADKVSAHRVVEGVGLPLARVKTIRASIPAATINDLFMTTVGSALRRYLAARGELPEATLTRMVPMSFRGPDKTADVGNQIGMAVMPRHTELHDPIDRLQEIRRGAAKAKAFNAVVGRDLAARSFEVLPEPAFFRGMPAYKLRGTRARGGGDAPAQGRRRAPDFCMAKTQRLLGLSCG